MQALPERAESNVITFLWVPKNNIKMYILGT